MLKPLSIAAGATVSVDAHGRFFRCREASAEFQLRIGSELLTLNGGDEYETLDGEPFKRLVFTNPQTVPITIFFTAAMNVIRSAYFRQARTKMIGWDITGLAIGGRTEYPGISTDDTEYLDAGIPIGARRKQFIVSTRSALIGKILIYSKVTEKLLGICPGGFAFTFDSDEDIIVENRSDGAASSTGSNPDIAVSESFYA